MEDMGSRQQRSLQQPGAAVTSLAVTASAAIIASASKGGPSGGADIWLWDAPSGTRTHQLHQHREGVQVGIQGLLGVANCLITPNFTKTLVA